MIPSDQSKATDDGVYDPVPFFVDAKRQMSNTDSATSNMSDTVE